MPKKQIKALFKLIFMQNVAQMNRLLSLKRTHDELQISQMALLPLFGALLHGFGNARLKKHIHQHAAKAQQLKPPQTGLHAGYQSAAQSQTQGKVP
jgi:hypothetical protein